MDLSVVRSVGQHPGNDGIERSQVQMIDSRGMIPQNKQNVKSIEGFFSATNDFRRLVFVVEMIGGD